ncbi:hypothetical protein GOP47_0013281 [Adiantum capillus-veneris]|uniref:Proteasome inhibitor PI31 subunit n=1 Tax=Adiantum capillus-veneris TaxID=13818 RepID=A0A9D4UNF6_ADICA|nr:hypothetical protein GOP47_0013281 [Adiantum capillus-veneris]
MATEGAFQSAGYSLIAVGSRVPPDLPAGDEEVEEVGIDGWNDMDGAYAFLYSGAGQEGLCKFVLVKCVTVDDKLIVAVTNENDKEALQLEIRVTDYVTPSEGTNYGQLYKRLNELVEQVNSSLLSKLSCPKDKPRIFSKMRDTKEVSIEEEVRQPSILVDEPAPSVRGLRYPPVPGYGSSDLLPGAGAGVFPSSFDPGVGGMLVGPNDPRWGSMGYGEMPTLPDTDRGILPPGARYDPVGPPGFPGFEPGRFTRGRHPPGGGPNPDLEHFSPF